MNTGFFHQIQTSKMGKQTILNYESAAAAALNGKPKQRAPYKRGPKSTETGMVVGVHEEPEVPPMPKPETYGWEAACPLGSNGGGGWQIEGGEEAYHEALARHVAAVNAQPGKPIPINRPNIPNRYDREALRDFYDGTALKEAHAHFDYLVKNARGVTEKQAFAATIFEHAPTI